jgi:uncharacterized protein (TIGR03067 family)
VSKPTLANNPGEVSRGDRERIQGTWKYLSIASNGKKWPDNKVSLLRMIVQGDGWTVMAGAQRMEEASFHLDPTKKPKTIDVTVMEGPDKGTTFQGIYELEGDRWKLYFAKPPWGRPQEISSEPGPGYDLSILTR